MELLLVPMDEMGVLRCERVSFVGFEVDVEAVDVDEDDEAEADAEEYVDKLMNSGMLGEDFCTKSLAP